MGQEKKLLLAEKRLVVMIARVTLRFGSGERNE
jgi:hypothetical protein